MPDYGTSMLALIDSRVAEGQKRVAKMGTVSDRSAGDLVSPPGRYWVSVVFDGSGGTAMPVKCFETLLVRTGDRVGLIKFEGEWVVVGNYSPRWPEGGQIFTTTWGGTVGTTSGTFVDMPTSPSVTIFKNRDHTFLRVRLSVGNFSNTVNDIAEFAYNVTSADGVTSYDETLFTNTTATAGAHIAGSGGSTSAALPGGQNYTITARWRRRSGSGTPSVNLLDALTLEAQEVFS